MILAFGDTVVEFGSTFSIETVEDATHIARALALASCVRDARVFRD